MQIAWYTISARHNGRAEENVVRVCFFVMCALVGLGALSPVHAAGNRGQQPRQVNWQVRDTAIYVVSTLNLLRTGSGHSFAAVAQRQLSVDRFDVYSDLDQRDLYFVQLKRDDGTVAGVLAYMMGWPKPKSVTSAISSMGIDRAPEVIVQAFKADRLKLFGSFTSTLPRV
jgi:hypothetical protein